MDISLCITMKDENVTIDSTYTLASPQETALVYLALCDTVKHNPLKSKNPLVIYSDSTLVEPSLTSSIISDILDPPLAATELTTDQTSHLTSKSHKQTTGKKYKPVALKTKLIIEELPGKFHII